MSGTTLVSDQENQRVVELGYPLAGTATSEGLWLGLPGVRKVISRIEVDCREARRHLRDGRILA